MTAEITELYNFSSHNTFYEARCFNNSHFFKNQMKKLNYLAAASTLCKRCAKRDFRREAVFL